MDGWVLFWLVDSKTILGGELPISPSAYGV